MDSQIGRKSKSFLKEKILRFKPVVFLKRNIFVFSFLLLFSFSLLLNIWDIKKYEIFQINGEMIDEKVNSKIEEYMLKNVLGQNFFMFSSENFQENIYSEIPYLKNVAVEKEAPNKLVLFIDVYEPFYVASLKTKCYILSEEGNVLEDICNEDSLECCLNSSLDLNLIWFSSTVVDVSILENNRRELLLMDDIGKIVKVVEELSYQVKSINLEEEILEIKDKEDRVFKFTITDNIEIQLRRGIAVVNKARDEGMDFKSLDLRFERPIMKN